jgi:ubiquinone/menaquinone biosynthesis C-methylase UbiE
MSYGAKLVSLRLKLIRDMYVGGCLLDLCCGSGDYLLQVARFAEKVVAMDFSPELITVAQQRAAALKRGKVSFCVCSARAIPLRTESIALLFSFSSLYYIPRIQYVVNECSRVLTKGGVAILEFGILHSLNTLVCRYYPELAAPCHLPLIDVHKILVAAGLKVRKELSFQILPLWGERPSWLRPLLWWRWEKILGHAVGRYVLDQVISGLWPLRYFAFRHIVVCVKG